MKKLKGAETKLEKAVQRIVNHHSADYDNGAEGFMGDLLMGGCQSGLVGELVYTSDCVKFYRRHMQEIDTRLADLCSDVGELPSKLFERAGWDDTDPLARGDMNQNILAWFGFEETARTLAERNGMEL